MNKKGKDKLEKAFKTYFREIHEIYVGGNFREESFYPSLKGLMEEYSQLYSLKGDS